MTNLRESLQSALDVPRLPTAARLHVKAALDALDKSDRLRLAVSGDYVEEIPGDSTAHAGIPDRLPLIRAVYDHCPMPELALRTLRLPIEERVKMRHFPDRAEG